MEASKEPVEVVGTVSLLNRMLEGPIVGSFSINAVQFLNFSASSPGEVVRKINAVHPGGVTAELDDQYRLVLVSPSGRDILLADGSMYDAHVANTIQSSRKEMTPQDEFYRLMLAREQDRSRVSALELLGLTSNDAFRFAGQDDWEPGRSAEQRAAARAPKPDDANPVDSQPGPDADN